MATKPLALSQREFSDLERLERVIRAGLAHFCEVGRALVEIRDRRLYRVTHKNFEEYCQDRFGMSKTSGNRLIAAAKVDANLTPIGVKVQNEYQARALTPLPDEVQRIVWQRAIKLNPQPTHEDLDKALAEAVQEDEETAKKVKPLLRKRKAPSWRMLRGEIEYHARQCRKRHARRPQVAPKADDALDSYLRVIRKGA